MRTIISILVVLTFFINTHGQHSTFVVTSSGTNDTIDSCINYTTDIWSQYIVSDIPIKVKIIYGSLTLLGPLGITFPNGKKDFPNAPKPAAWYPSCLANAISKTELNPGEADMDIYINSVFSWYFGTDGTPPNNQYDFVSVLLHEMGHGLGIASLAKVDSGEGSFGMLTTNDYYPLTTSFPFPDLSGLPSVFDLQLVNANGEYISDTLSFPNNSALLNDEFTSTNIYYNGNYGVFANNSEQPKIYAPSTFTLGSSITHLDENTFPAGSGNELMTPFSGKGEAAHLPGSITLGILEDIGWQNAFTSVYYVNKAPFFLKVKTSPNPFNQYTTISYSIPKRTHVYLVVYDLYGKCVKVLNNTNQESGDYSISWNGTDMTGSKTPCAIYMYKLVTEKSCISGKIQFVK